MDVGQSWKPLITPKTKAVIPVHYANIACDMASIMALAEKIRPVCGERPPIAP